MQKLLFAFAILTACSKAPEPAAPAAVVERKDLKVNAVEQGNLLNMARGGSVVSRTGELTLDNSAAGAIDGENATTWSTPPADINQTAVFALAAPAKIESIGVLTPAADQARVNNLRLESSIDGTKYTILSEPALTASRDPQTFAVTPVEAQFLRVTITGAAGNFPAIQSLQARGAFLSAPQAARIAGCWTVNGEPASFEQRGTSVSGRMGAEVSGVLRGGVEGAVYRLTWVRGPDHGVAAITVAPGSRALSGLLWYVKAHPIHTGGGLFGEKSSCGSLSSAAARDVVATFLERDGRYPLFGLQFDENDKLIQLDDASLEALAAALRSHPQARIRLVAREYRSVSPAENAARAKRRIDALKNALTSRGTDLSRLDLVAAGSEEELFTPTTDLIRLMHSAIEIAVK